MSLLEVRNLRIAYDDFLVIENVDLSVNDGELVAIRTAVLDGGTSLLKGIGGLLLGCEGSVMYRGQDLLHGPSREVSASIGFVYEEAGLVSLYTILQNISLPLRFHSGLSNEEIRSRVESICEFLDIDQELLKLRPHELNDVQTRFINLARALIVKPGVLLIDELEGGMSEEMLVATMKRIRGYQEEHPMAVIMTTSSDLVLAQADRVYHIEHCMLAAQDS